ncbi:hypothetical protein, partial [Salmonella sp. s51884]|uniref:hypothetical protein n=1 Tax=Salmonella sp. s51884 TaxID=3159654 RepID=UPI00397EE261
VHPDVNIDVKLDKPDVDIIDDGDLNIEGPDVSGVADATIETDIDIKAQSPDIDLSGKKRKSSGKKGKFGFGGKLTFGMGGRKDDSSDDKSKLKLKGPKLDIGADVDSPDLEVV